ncbi:spore germination protein [Paenibacillus rhizosphaerae]|uniref:Spore germination protein n=1 Tax=Paenibacillus rhizosphaerae TaxID=297318 RepID=A0A839TP91_9BACL|nr:Ger(x)C family spore germination protein [Paenibacillus rhizosphaerae]MBB3128585.1 spore germination protein [Paenibacillus rhizosphaerae]
MKRLLLVLTSCLLLTACTKQQILDRSTLFLVSALDNAPNGQLEVTLGLTKFKAGDPGSVSDEFFSKVGHTSSGITDLMNMQLVRPINPGKLSVVLFGKDKAAHGLSQELDVILRNAQYSRRMYLAVVDGEAKKLLEGNFSSGEEKGLFLYNLFDTNTRKGLIPSRNLHQFEYSLVGKGIDPFLPLLKMQNGKVAITGMALFKDDRYVVTINEKQARIMKLLMNQTKRGIFEAKLGEGSYVSIDNTGSKVNYRIYKNSRYPSVMINLVIEGKVRDSREVTYPNQELRRIEESIKKDIRTSGLELINLLKEKEIDPLGLGDFVRSKTRNWSEEAWKEMYPSLNVRLLVTVHLTETGVKK